MQNILKTIWLFISSFGIMFAVLSWLQEAGVLSNADGWWKGGFALACGTILYLLVPSRMGD
ncbi:MAG: hypothetical protein QF765_03560 [Candidatus Marinimicrobia bacterium]|nr:hypothetical protein [Candidatus Neomarinimicrobiota bacterium]